MKDTDVKEILSCPGWVAQLVTMLSGYAKIAGLMPGQGTYKKQQIWMYK